MRDYELIYIISPDVAEDDVPGIIEKISEFVATRGGTVDQIERWGKRRLAYPIERFREGNYVLTRLKLVPGATQELEGNLQISEKILRHLLVRVE